MSLLLIILQIYTLNVGAFKYGNAFYAPISPKIAFGSEEILSGNNVLMIKIDSSLVGTQHEQFYGLRKPYFRLRCDIVDEFGVAYYMDRVDYLNDKSSLQNLRE